MRTAPSGGRNVERGLVTTFRVLGPGRAGRSLMAALDAVGGYRSLAPWGRDRSPVDAAHGVDLLFIATPDDVVADVAAAVRPVDTTAVIHLSGSLGLDVLAGHARRGSLHPLVPLPDPAIGADRLRSGITFAVAGDPAARTAAEDLGGNVVEVGDPDRAAYHAAAVIAANHLVALMGQVERVAATAGLPLDAFAGLMRAAAEDALALGPRRALTGPAARGDWETVERHRAAIASMPAHRTELAGYDAMVALARRLSLDTAEGLDPSRAGATASSGSPTRVLGAAAEQVA
jgi:predicted short-subunit dehydrogenase-like oxidoreductase (DUF2520 family)